MKHTKATNKDKFSVHLEGIEVPFNTASISEAEGSIPVADVTFAGIPDALRLLPGTICQIFGEAPEELDEPRKQYLLFEGELTDLGYSNSPGSDIVSLRFASLLQNMMTTKLKPTDTLMSTTEKAYRLQSDKISRVTVTCPAPSSEAVTNGMLGISSEATILEYINTSKKMREPFSQEGSLKELIAINKLGGLADEFSSLLAPDSPAAAGDFLPMIHAFNKYFETNHLYYGVLSYSFKLSSSIFAFPNPGVGIAVRNNVVLESVANYGKASANDFLGVDDTFSLFQCLAEFQRYFHYSFVTPAAFFGTNYFFQKGPIKDKASLTPYRGVYMPYIESGPPILCNVFFPEQFINIQYQRGFRDEPTRLIGRASYKFTENLPAFSLATVVVPSMELTKNKERGIDIAYSTEETYRGIFLKSADVDMSTATVLKNSKKITADGKSKDSPMTESDMKSDIGVLLKEMATEEFLRLKFSTRGIAFTAEWSPYRLIGFPGMIFKPGTPTIVGVVSSINTVIAADGKASQNISFRNCRVIFDEQADYFLETNPPTDYNDYKKWLINPLSSEAITAANETWFNPDLYSFTKIGKDFYTYITTGFFLKDGTFAKYVNNIWKDYNDNVNKITTINQDLNYSILRYLKPTQPTPVFESTTTTTSSSPGAPKKIDYEKAYKAGWDALQKKFSVPNGDAGVYFNKYVYNNKTKPNNISLNAFKGVYIKVSTFKNDANTILYFTKLMTAFSSGYHASIKAQKNPTSAPAAPVADIESYEGIDKKIKQLPMELQYTYILKQAIKSFKTTYKNLRDQGNLPGDRTHEVMFAQELNKRALVEKDSYLTSIGAHNGNNTGDKFYIDAKDLVDILDKPKEIRALVEKINPKDLKTTSNPNALNYDKAHAEGYDEVKEKYSGSFKNGKFDDKDPAGKYFAEYVNTNYKTPTKIKSAEFKKDYTKKGYTGGARYLDGLMSAYITGYNASLAKQAPEDKKKDSKTTLVAKLALPYSLTRKAHVFDVFKTRLTQIKINTVTKAIVIVENNI